MSAPAHVRIDEGVKRGPRQQRRPGPIALRRDEEGQVEAIPEGLDPNAVLDRYLSERTTSQIAKDLGVKRKSLVAWLRAQAPDRWKAVQVVRALVRKDDSNEDLEEANDALSLARARELLRSAQWDLERLDAASFGPKQEIMHSVSPVLNISVAIAPQVTHSVIDHNAHSEDVTHSVTHSDARTQHLDALASLTPEELAALQASTGGDAPPA